MLCCCQVPGLKDPTAAGLQQQKPAGIRSKSNLQQHHPQTAVMQQNKQQRHQQQHSRHTAPQKNQKQHQQQQQPAKSNCRPAAAATHLSVHSNTLFQQLMQTGGSWTWMQLKARGHFKVGWCLHMAALPLLLQVHNLQMTASCMSSPKCTLAALMVPSRYHGRPTAVPTALVLPITVGSHTAPRLAANQQYQACSPQLTVGQHQQPPWQQSPQHHQHQYQHQQHQQQPVKDSAAWAFAELTNALQAAELSQIPC